MPSGIEPSNLDKVFWPEDGLTKGDLLAYFEAVAPFILPVLRNRPLTVVRYPDGMGGFSFYQKNTPKYAPPWVRTVELPAESARRNVHYTLCNSKRTLLWLANQAAIELHPWLSRRDRLDRPDHLVLDLDPPGTAFDLAVEVAFRAREVLREAGLRAALKTSGAKGLHLFVPIWRRYEYGAVRLAAVRIAERVVEHDPDLSTMEFRRASRGHRVFLDVGRNAPGAHIVAPYSPRARAKATVSFPVAWERLARTRPEDFTLANVPGLLKRGGDRWRQSMPDRQTLPDDLLETATGRA
ncbi:MAG: non-homologous end-joining DNA ligase [Actinomycetota bacterium]